MPRTRIAMNISFATREEKQAAIDYCKSTPQRTVSRYIQQHFAKVTAKGK